MNNVIKTGLGFLLGGGLVLVISILNKKKNKVKSFIAPDGNSYNENELYRNADGKFFKNGKMMSFEKPRTRKKQDYDKSTYDDNPQQINYKEPFKNASYHQKGIRHH